jgi:hypothetical protein
MTTNYYFDKIEIHCGAKRDDLRVALPIRLHKHCKLMAIENRKKGGSRINVFIPDSIFFKILNQPGILPTQCQGFSVEIARDTGTPTRHHAQSEASKIQDISYFKNATEHKFYDVENSDYNTYLKLRRTPDKFGSTLYSGTKNITYVVYSRFGKISNRPALHEEFRIENNLSLISYAGIGCINDFINYDIELTYENLFKKYVRQHLIDYRALGLWLKNWTRKKKLSKRQRDQAHLAGLTFCQAHAINSYGALIVFLKTGVVKMRETPQTEFDPPVGKVIEKRNFGRNLLKHQPGRKTDFEERIMKLRARQLSCFRTDLSQSAT